MIAARKITLGIIVLLISLFVFTGCQGKKNNDHKKPDPAAKTQKENQIPAATNPDAVEKAANVMVPLPVGRTDDIGMITLSPNENGQAIIEVELYAVAENATKAFISLEPCKAKNNIPQIELSAFDEKSQSVTTIEEKFSSIVLSDQPISLIVTKENESLVSCAQISFGSNFSVEKK